MWFRRLLDVVRSEVSKHPAFFAVFGAFVVWAYVIAWRSPIGPGQDQHYHLMNAALTARWWTGDPEVRALYKFITPLDCNTLVYTLLFPFELVMSPVRAWGWGFGTIYFVGYPVACLVALRILRRPLWGAVLAFPLAYVFCWTHGGYLPFVSSAPFFIVALAAMHRVLQPPDREAPETRRRLTILVAVTSALTCLGHGHVYTWLMMTLALLTLLSQLRGLVSRLAVEPKSALLEPVRIGLLALALVTPSLILFGTWYWRLLHANAASQNTGYLPTEETWQIKWNALPARFIQTTTDAEWKHLAVLFGLVVLALLLSGGPRRREIPSPEIAFGLALASYFLLPFKATATDLGLRQPDFVAWLIPLIVYPRHVPKAAIRSAVVVTAIVAFAVFRLSYLQARMTELKHEYAGLVEVAKPCPSTNGELAYVTFGMYSKPWGSVAFHQAHETYAAICKIDTPVYDPTEYPHNFIPVRYRGKPPSPITILFDQPRWYAHPNLWKNFDVVLVHKWNPSPADLAEVSKVATRVRSNREWELWQRKTEPVPLP